MPLYLCIFWHDRYSSISYLFYKGIFSFLSALPLGQDAKSSQLNYQDRFIISSRGTCISLLLQTCWNIRAMSYSLTFQPKQTIPWLWATNTRRRTTHKKASFIVHIWLRKTRIESEAKKETQNKRERSEKENEEAARRSPTNSTPTGNQSSSYRYHQESPSLNKPPRMTKP